jgi:hypothetical protein
MNEVLDQAHNAQRRDRYRWTTVEEICSTAKNKFQNRRRRVDGAGERGASKRYRSHFTADPERRADACEGADHYGRFAAIEQQSDEYKSIVNSDIDVGLGNADGNARSDNCGDQCQQEKVSIDGCRRDG